MISWGGITSGLRSRLQVHVQLRARVRKACPGPVPEPEHLNLMPDGRDLGPENKFSAATYPVSGFPLSASNPATCHPGPPPAT